MTVQNITAVEVSAFGAGAPLNVTIPGQFYSDAEIKVFVIDTAIGAESPQIPSIEYMVTKTRVVGSSPAVYTGSVSTIGNISATEKVIVYVDPENEQTTSFTSRPFSSADYERALDLASRRDAAIEELVKRSPRFPLDYTGAQPIYDTPLDGRTTVWDEARKRFANGPSVADVANAQENAAIAAAAAATAVAVVGGLENLQDLVDDAEGHANDAAASAAAAASAVSAFVIGGYGVFLPETRTWLKYLYDNALYEPRHKESRAIDDYIAALVDCGAWPLLDVVSVFFLPGAPLVSLKNPGVFVWSALGGIVHEPRVGYAGDAIGKYLQLNAAPSGMVNFVRDGATIGVQNTAGTTFNNLMSTLSGAGGAGLGILPATAAGQYSIRVNNTTAFSLGFPGERSGYSIGVRSGPNNLGGYRDGALIAETGASASTAPSASPFTLLRTGSGYDDDTVHSAIIGGALTADMVAASSAALAELRATIGEF